MGENVGKRMFELKTKIGIDIYFGDAVLERLLDTGEWNAGTTMESKKFVLRKILINLGKKLEIYFFRRIGSYNFV